MTSDARATTLIQRRALRRGRAFVAARDSCNDAMREMHRVMFSMALSANMDAAALNRSAESKGKDEATTTVLLNAFGKILLKFARRLLVLASLGRQQPVPKAQISGLEDFDAESVTAAINEAVAFFSGVPQLSPLVRCSPAWARRAALVRMARLPCNGAYLVNFTDAQCLCGFGCRPHTCKKSARHWFCCPNLPGTDRVASAVLAEVS